MQRSLVLWGIYAAGLGLTIALQWQAGSFDMELGALNSDEAPHYINGLLIARYVTSGVPASPLKFAAAFYQHFPKVSIGHWPPLFYLFEGAWMVVASASRASVMVLSAAITTGLATVMAAIGARRHGALAAAGVAAAFLLLPLIREMTAALLVDIAVALLEFVAAWALIAYFYQPGWRRAAWFGVAASAAIMTKGNGLALALLPPNMILLTGRADLLRRADFWLPAPIVAVLCGPWYAATSALVNDGFFYEWGRGYSQLSLLANASFIVASLGAPCLLLAAVGAARSFRPGLGLPEAILRQGLMALTASVFVFQVVVPADLQSRYMIPLFAPVILLAAAGLADLTAALCASRRIAVASVALLGGLAAIPGVLLIEHRPAIGMREAAQLVVEERGPPRPVLIAAGAPGEGAFIVEMAMRAGAASAPIARGTKFLASADFDGGHYVGRFANASDLAAAIRAAGFGVVVLDTSASSWRYVHNRLVEQAAKEDGWRLLTRQQHQGIDGETRVYRIEGPAPSTLASATCTWSPGAPASGSGFALTKPMTGC